MSASLMAVNGMHPPCSCPVQPQERGSVVRQGLRALRTAMPNVLAMADKLSPRMIHLIQDSVHWGQALSD